MSQPNDRGRQLAVWVSQEAHADLAELCRIYGQSQREIIEMLVRGKARELKELQA